MPTYDYYCESNDRTIEASHKMSERLANWGELCERAGIEPGDTPADAPVRKLISGPAIIGANAGHDELPACASGGCCSGGSCGLE